MRDFVKYSSSDTLEEMIEAFQEEAGEVLFAGDERRMILNSFAYLAEIIMNEINYRTNNNLIAFCDEETLILKGEERNVKRDQAERARVNVRFTAEVAQETIKIKKETRVTAEGELFFQTTEDKEILTGETQIEIECEAVQEGEKYNGIPAGEIKILTDTIPYIIRVENTDISSGGKEIEGLEDYRKRVLNAPKTYNTTGIELAYIEKVKEVDADIADVFLENDNTTVKIYFICKNGVIPGETLIEKVKKHITDNSVRTFTDAVVVFPAQKYSYVINAEYMVSAADEETAETIKTNVGEAVNEYINKMKSKLGLAINPEELRRFLYNAGAASVNITEPQEYRSISGKEIAIGEVGTITFRGFLR